MKEITYIYHWQSYRLSNFMIKNLLKLDLQLGVANDRWIFTEENLQDDENTK